MPWKFKIHRLYNVHRCNNKNSKRIKKKYYIQNHGKMKKKTTTFREHICPTRFEPGRCLPLESNVDRILSTFWMKSKLHFGLHNGSSVNWIYAYFWWSVSCTNGYMLFYCKFEVYLSFESNVSGYMYIFWIK